MQSMISYSYFCICVLIFMHGLLYNLFNDSFKIEKNDITNDLNFNEEMTKIIQISKI